MAGALDVNQKLQVRVEQVQQENRTLKMKYDALLEKQRRAEMRLWEEKVREGHLLKDMIHPKQRAAAHMNSHNERRSRYMKLTPPWLRIRARIKVPAAGVVVSHTPPKIRAHCVIVPIWWSSEELQSLFF